MLGSGYFQDLCVSHAQFDEFYFPFVGSHSSSANFVVSSFYEPPTRSIPSQLPASPIVQASPPQVNPLACPSCVSLDAPIILHHDPPASPEPS